MKAFKIQLSYCNRRKKFYVYNGWNKFIYFNNKRKADDWRRKAQRVFRDTQMQIHSLNCQTYNLYSIFYFSFNDKITRTYITNLSDFEKFFRHSFNNFSNGNSVKFDSIFTCFNCIEESILLFKSFGQTHKLYALTYQCNTLLKSHVMLHKEYSEAIVDLDLTDEIYKSRVIKNIELKAAI